VTILRDVPDDRPLPGSFFEPLAMSIHLRRYKEQVYTVFATYLDESFDMNQRDIFAVGGVVGHYGALFELDRKWEALLKRPDINIDFFKAAKCARGTDQFAKFVKIPGSPTPEEQKRLDAISHEFISLIAKEPNVIVYGIGVIQNDFQDVIKDKYALSVLGNDPFPFAYDLAMVQAAWIMKEGEKARKSKSKGRRVEPYLTSFVADDHEVYGPLAAERYVKLKASNPEAEKYMGSHSLGDDKKVCVLQAADAVAYEIRRVLHIAHKQTTKAMRPQFKLFRDFSKMATIHTAVKQNLLNTVSLHKPGDSFNLSDVMETEYTENIRIEEEEEKT